MKQGEEYDLKLFKNILNKLFINKLFRKLS
jgi:hypothetical protein